MNTTNKVLIAIAVGGGTYLAYNYFSKQEQGILTESTVGKIILSSEGYYPLQVLLDSPSLKSANPRFVSLPTAIAQIDINYFELTKKVGGVYNPEKPYDESRTYTDYLKIGNGQYTLNLYANVLYKTLPNFGQPIPHLNVKIVVRDVKDNLILDKSVVVNYQEKTYLQIFP